MTRTKNFSREKVLQTALPVFWRKGFADTSIKDLEHATGVNKSGLYSEFKDKDDLFSCTLDYYIAMENTEQDLLAEPLGWENIVHFFRSRARQEGDERGCLIIFSLREMDLLNAAAKKRLSTHMDELRNLFSKNVASEKTNMPADQIADLLVMLFSGLALNDNLHGTAEIDPAVYNILGVMKKL